MENVRMGRDQLRWRAEVAEAANSFKTLSSLVFWRIVWRVTMQPGEKFERFLRDRVRRLQKMSGWQYDS